MNKLSRKGKTVTRFSVLFLMCFWIAACTPTQLKQVQQAAEAAVANGGSNGQSGSSNTTASNQPASTGAQQPNSTTTPAQNPPNDNTDTVGERNTDRPGSDYLHFDSAAGGADVTAQICEQSCRDDGRCTAWTFVKPNTIQGPKGVCWLKNAVPSPVANSCCASGVFNRPAPANADTTGEQNTDRWGSDYARLDTAPGGADVTAKFCEQSCLNDGRCKAWTFVKPNTVLGPKGLCFLKDPAPAPTANNCCSSGVPNRQVGRVMIKAPIFVPIQPAVGANVAPRFQPNK